VTAAILAEAERRADGSLDTRPCGCAARPTAWAMRPRPVCY